MSSRTSASDSSDLAAGLRFLARSNETIGDGFEVRGGPSGGFLAEHVDTRFDARLDDGWRLAIREREPEEVDVLAREGQHRAAAVEPVAPRNRRFVFPATRWFAAKNRLVRTADTQIGSPRAYTVL